MHSARIAVAESGEVVGAAWIARVDRVPRPGHLARRSAGVQSVYVVPEFRGRGLGGALVEAVCADAADDGATRIVVHASERAIPLYRRLGFTSGDRLRQRRSED